MLRTQVPKLSESGFSRFLSFSRSHAPAWEREESVGTRNEKENLAIPRSHAGAWERET